MSQSHGQSIVAGSKLVLSNPQAGLVFVFTSAILLSALLLFSVQPIFTKMTLPLLGGSSNVWNTAMVFFQATLLAGYLYAHCLTSYASLRTQIIIHVIVMGVGLFFLPLAVASGWLPTASNAPGLWLIGLFAVSVGVPFFALSANAPLFQRWFSYTSHQNAHDPYFLYAASNIGSLVSLALYPLVLEPNLALSQQGGLWKAFYIVMIAAAATAGLFAIKNKRAGVGPENEQTELPRFTHISWQKRGQWIMLAFIPSALMLSVTSHLSTNVAQAPFLWVLPLGLYLLTFVFAFAARPLISPRLVYICLIPAIIIGLFYTRLSVPSFFLMVLIHLAIFFIIAQACHFRLAAERPASSRLTEFYLLMSFGGVLGGVFTALLAPAIFNQIYEYPLLIAVSSLVMLNKRPSLRKTSQAFGVAGLLGVIIVLLALGLFYSLPKIWEPIVWGVFLCAALVLVLKKEDVIFFFAGTVSLMIAFGLITNVFGAQDKRIIFQDRGFYGVVKVSQYVNKGDLVRVFYHGDTVHNMQVFKPELQKEPLAYYAREGAFGQALDVMREQRQEPLNVAVIGLGAGAMACHALAEENWTYYEIDPLVVKMARNPDYFSYLSQCAEGAAIKIGDGRLLIADEKDDGFDLIILDAFSSDSIPAHLLTREAFSLYQQKLSPNGLVFFHTSNRFLDVSSVAAVLAGDAGLQMRATQYEPSESTPYAQYKTKTHAVIIGQENLLRDGFASRDDWSRFEPHPKINVWTDDYSNIIGAIMARSDGGGVYLDHSGQSKE